MRTVIIVTLTLLLVTACISAGDVSGATKSEVSKACRELRKVGYDYWNLNVLEIGGRTLEVAADIHTNHPGPAQTKAFCEGR